MIRAALMPVMMMVVGRRCRSDNELIATSSVLSRCVLKFGVGYSGVH